MGILRSLLTLPVCAPVNGTLWIGRKVHEASEREFNDPASLRKALQSLEKKLLSGEISEEAYDAEEMVLLLRLKAVQ